VRFSNWLTERRFRTLGWIWAGILLFALVVLGFLWWRDELRLQTDIYALLPRSQLRAELRAANQQVNDSVNNRLFLLLEAPAAASIESATTTLVHSAAGAGLLRPEPAADVEELSRKLFEHRGMLLAAEEREQLGRGDYDALIGESLGQLSNPLFLATAASLRADPWQFFPRYLMGLAANAGDVSLVSGWPQRQTGPTISRLLIFRLGGAPYDSTYQQRLNAWLSEQRLALEKQYQLRMRATGTVLFAAAASSDAERQINIIGFGSLLGLALLVWASYGSLRPMLTDFIAIGAGSVVACLTTQFVFGEIHLITLVFGASLMGVSVDYSMLFLCAQAAEPTREPRSILVELMPRLLLGLLTTIAAYGCLALTPFPGLRQIAVFSAAGLVTAWLTGMLLLPRLRPLDTRRAHAVLKPLASLRAWAARLPLPAAWLYAGIAGLLALVVWHWQPEDNVRSLQSVDATLLQDEEQIRARFNDRQSGQYFLIAGAGSSELSERESRLCARLAELRAAGQLQGFTAVGDWLPTAAQQEADRRLQQGIPRAVLMRYADAAGIQVGVLLNWQADLAHAAPLQVADLGASPLRQLLLGDTARIVMLNGIRNLPAVAAISDIPGVQFVDPVNDLSALFGHYRVQGQWLILIATVLLSAILIWRYELRSLHDMMSPVLLSVVTTLLLLQLCHVDINLFVVFALFLLLGIGVDYAIFFRESRGSNQTVTVAVTLCMLSTALSFGLLGFSHTPVIRGFGLTALFGVLTSFLYATLLTRGRADTGQAGN
jgi:predicted exporter